MVVSKAKLSGSKLSPHSDFREGDVLGMTIGREWNRKGNKGRRLRIGTWNVRTMKEGGKLENLKEEMKLNNLDLVGLCEVRWKGSGEVRSGEYRMLYSGSEKGGRNGVGMILGKRLKDKLIKVEYIDDRVMMIRLQGKKKDLVVIQIYICRQLDMQRKKWKNITKN